MGKNIHMALETQAKHRLMIFQGSFCLSCWLWSVSVHHLQGSMILSDISSGESLWLESSSILRPCTLQLQFYRCGQVTHRPTEDLYSRAPSAGPKAKLQQKKRKIFAVFQVFFFIRWFLWIRGCLLSWTSHQMISLGSLRYCYTHLKDQWCEEMTKKNGGKKADKSARLTF